jgi:hypothetical protein
MRFDHLRQLTSWVALRIHMDLECGSSVGAISQQIEALNSIPSITKKKKKKRKEKETIDSLNAVFIKYFSETELLLFISETELKACVRYKCSATCF